MKVVILAGGYGTRISEESDLKPKPMVEIGDMPVLWHIMKYYSHYGFNDFIICCGYKGFTIKEYFANYYLHNSDVTFDFADNNKMFIHGNVTEPWKVTLIDTGVNTMTGGRIKRVKKYLDGEPFMLTYGDGVSDIDLNELLKFHKKKNRTATITAVWPGARFGALEVAKNGKITKFSEKANAGDKWVNGGFMIMEPEIFDHIKDDDTVFEKDTLEKLASRGELMAFKHKGFWQCMDTLRDKRLLDELYKSKKAPWVVW
jgi:glucose-1-phosphate cytidylyltransferase